MNKKEFNQAWAIAVERPLQDLSNVSDDHLFGCGLPDFERVATTIEPVAKLLRWQCVCLDGSIDQEELNNMRDIARKKFDLISPEK